MWHMLDNTSEPHITDWLPTRISVPMARPWTSLPPVRGWRLTAMLAVVGFLLVGGLAASQIDRFRSLVREVRWLRARLAEKHEVIAQQREEMAAVAAQVDRIARTALVARERAAQARRLAHMEESRDVPRDPATPVATLDGQETLVSEDAARTLEKLAWLDVQTAQMSDSFAVLAVLVKQRAETLAGGVPAMWPVRGLVTSTFGMRSDPYDGARAMHTGIDIQARYGTPIGVTAGGEVLVAGQDPGYGSLVVVDHGRGVQTWYGHLSSIYVREGQRVRRGQAIGALGASGRATGAHLHYEVREDGVPVDPVSYLRVRPENENGFHGRLASVVESDRR